MKNFAALRLFVPSLLVGFTFVACSDDSSPASPGAGDGGAGAETSTGTPGEGGAPAPVPEPTCDPLSGDPTWTFKDKVIADWTGNPEQDIFGPKLLGISGIAYGNGLWVLMARSQGRDSVTWATSTDGATWTPRTQALPGVKLQNRAGVIYDGKQFLFLAIHDQVGAFAYRSADGMTWTASKVADGAVNIDKVVSDNGTAVFVGANGSMYSSHDLMTWTPQHPEPGNGFGYLDIAGGGGHFVATANAGIGPFVSPNGDTWTKTTQIGQNLSYGKGFFHARTGGSFEKSADGATWTDEPQSGTGFGVTSGGEPTFAGGRFILAQIDFFKAEGMFAMSVDGAVWTDWGKSTGLSSNAGRGVLPGAMAYGGCHYIQVGNYGMADATVVPFMVVGTAPPAP